MTLQHLLFNELLNFDTSTADLCMSNIIKGAPTLGRSAFYLIFLLYLCEYSLENFRMLVCDLGEHFSVDLDLLFRKSPDEFAVGCAILSKSCIKADIPESSEVAFLVSSVVNAFAPACMIASIAEASLLLRLRRYPFVMARMPFLVLFFIVPRFTLVMVLVVNFYFF